jgi:hypothetical protein
MHESPKSEALKTENFIMWKFLGDKLATSDDLSIFLTHLMTSHDLGMTLMTLGDDILMIL